MSARKSGANDGFGAGGQQQISANGHRAAGGDNVVDEQKAASCDIGIWRDRIDVLHVCATFQRRFDGRLRRIVPLFSQSFFSPDTPDSRDMARQQLRLIKSAPQAAQPSSSGS